MEDHISGFIEYFKRYPEDTFKIKEYWCNCASRIEVSHGNRITAYYYAKNFADYLRSIQRECQNMRWTELIRAGHSYHNDIVDIEVIAPSEQALLANREIYIKEQYPTISYQKMKDDLEISLKELSKRGTPNSKQVVNNASIAFIIKADGKSYLMLGDVMADDVYNYLINKKYSVENPLELDYVKVAHHGSKHNISNKLLDIIRCNNYIISTNGGFGNAYHPDRETIAKILYHPQRDLDTTIHLYFNYTLDEIGKRTLLFKEGEIERANGVVHDNVLEL